MGRPVLPQRHLHSGDSVGAAESFELLCRSLRPGPDRVVLAVSGGPDSLALLVFAAENRNRLDLGVVVATVDHGLRPESADEARSVGRIAAHYDLPHLILEWHPGALRGNLPAAARDARYRLLAEAARASGAGAVVTAHHQDDQIETHLMAVERREGAARLAGMRERRDLQPGLVLLRPLLGVPKARLEASLRARDIPWASDPTNCDLRYRRALLRHRLRGTSEEARRTILDAIASAGQERDAIDRTVRRRLHGAVVDAAGVIEAPRASFGADGPAGYAVLSRILSAAGGAAGPASGPSVVRLAERLSGDEEAFVATLGGCRLTAGRGRVLVAREFGRAGPPALDPACGTCFDERFDLGPGAPKTGRLVPLGALGRGGAYDRTLPVALDPERRPVAAHPMALARLRPGLPPLALSERVSWRLRRDLPAPEGVSQIAAKEPSQVGKDFPADYLRLRRMERAEVDAQARPAAAQSQDER